MGVFFSGLGNDIGIDLGTANTLVYVRGLGIVINEPSVVALNNKTHRVVAVGHEAKAMMGRTPSHIEIVRPLVDGVISDYEITEEMLAYFISKADKLRPCLLRPRVVIGVPVGITHVEMCAVRDAARGAGARDIYIIEEPLAAAIGGKLPVHEALGSMIVDIGGGTSDIAVIALSGIVTAKSVKIAGDKLNRDICEYLRDKFKLLIGERTAEEVKIAIGVAYPELYQLSMTVKGRDASEGMPKEVTITDEDMRLAMGPSLTQIVERTRIVLESTPPEVLADIMNRGVHIAGGGALIRGISDLFETALGVPATAIEDPLTAVARGTGIIFEDFARYKPMLISNVDDVSII